jgi:hypothetical protein
MNLPKAVEKLKEKWDRFFATVERPCRCIFCEHDRIYWNGQRQRSASVLIGDQVVYLPEVRCRRVKCANAQCQKSWTLRPAGLMPRRHYQLCIVAHATSKFLFHPQATLILIAATHQCSRRTVGRWLQWLAGIAQPKELIRRLSSRSKKAVITALGKASGSGRRTFAGAAKILCLVEALATAYGYDPPGLRSMVEAAIYNRDRITTYQSPFIPELAR